MVKKQQAVFIVRSSAAEYLTFVAATGAQESSVEMRYENENIWLTQKMMAALYDVDVRTVNEHLKKVFDDGELMENEATVRNFRIVQAEGERQQAVIREIRLSERKFYQKVTDLCATAFDYKHGKDFA